MNSKKEILFFILLILLSLHFLGCNHCKKVKPADPPVRFKVLDSFSVSDGTHINNGFRTEHRF